MLSQRKSADFRDMIIYLEKGELPLCEGRARAIPYESSQYELINGVLYHIFQRRKKGKVTDDSIIKQIALPEGLRQDVLVQYHDNLNHFGVQKTYETIRQKYYFPKLYEHVYNYIK